MGVIFIAGAIQGSVGFGANVLAIPTLVLIDPAFVPVPALLAGFGINILMLLRDRRSASLRPIRNALIGRLFGTLAGIGALSALSERGLSALVAALVLGLVVVSGSGFTAARTARNMVVAGTVSGFSASTAGIGGPPVALLFQDATGAQIRGSLGAFFVAGNTVSLGAMGLAGVYGAEEVWLGLALMPAAVAGFLCTRWIVPFVDNGYTRPAILGLSSLAAGALIVRLLLS